MKLYSYMFRGGSSSKYYIFRAVHFLYGCGGYVFEVRTSLWGVINLEILEHCVFLFTVLPLGICP